MNSLAELMTLIKFHGGYSNSKITIALFESFLEMQC